MSFKSLLTLAALGVAAAKGDDNRSLKDKAMTGTNAGGWMVIEPWITPSLFYRFLGKTEKDVGIDAFTLCKALGPKEGNKLLKAHWDTWFTEQHFKDLADRGLEVIRLPVGDWTLNQYGPYQGCMDGAAEKIDWFYDMAAKYNIKVFMDVHCIKDSQNGFDNSGHASNVTWVDKEHYIHKGAGNWMGHWNDKTNKYDSINEDNIEFAIKNIELLIERYGKHPAFYAFQPVNEPWLNSDIAVLKDYYRKTRALLVKHAPEAKFAFHDHEINVDMNPKMWNDLFDDNDMKNVVYDHHLYQAWTDNLNSVDDMCKDYQRRAAVADKIKYPVWIGEWALGTDTCAHWLGGFNDGPVQTGKGDRFKCKWVDCPRTYLPDGVGVDFDRTADILGPYGGSFPQGSNIHKGKCSTDSDFLGHDDVGKLAKCAMDAFDKHVQATFLWTAHNEIEERWDFVKAHDLGWTNRKPLSPELQAKNKEISRLDNLKRGKIAEEKVEEELKDLASGLENIGGLQAESSFIEQKLQFTQ